MSDTYPQPKDGWLCFHCGERFMKWGTAQNHFGPRATSVPACILNFDEKEWLMDFRKLEEEIANLNSQVFSLQRRLELERRKGENVGSTRADTD